MKFSIIICYRDRLEHLNLLVPRLNHIFGDQAEIIVVEQYNKEKFLRGQMFNVGAQIAQGDILVFHDVDHFPHEVGDPPWKAYDPGSNDMMLPVKQITYVNRELKPKPIEEVPSGYRHFRESVDADFFGGVEVFKREAFFRINGFNTLYKGWGLEDADLRERVQHYKLTGFRGRIHFYGLDHKDSNPGINDEDFRRNQQIFHQWKDYLEIGVSTQFQTMDDIEPLVKGVDRWVQVSNVFTISKNAAPFVTLENMTEYYEDVPEKHTTIWTTFKSLVNEHEQLRPHRNWVVQNRFGYGNRAFHWMWNLIVKEAPRHFKFLEVGVYMGQIISLISMLNRIHQKEGTVYGITPLTNAGDKYSKHPEINYEQAIQTIYHQFGLSGDDLNLLVGLSTDVDIVKTTKAEGPYDMVYIDGCHDYEVVKSDLLTFPPMLKTGGILVVDDASSYLHIPDGLIRMDWRGLEDVSNAVRDVIEQDPQYEHLFAVGHNRVWRRA